MSVSKKARTLKKIQMDQIMQCNISLGNLECDSKMKSNRSKWQKRKNQNPEEDTDGSKIAIQYITGGLRG